VILPDALVETSGIAVSAARAGLYWTHNDDGSRLAAIDGSGRIVEEHTVGAAFRDWEDIELARCANGWCLYLADTGDNAEVRQPGSARIVRVKEPESGAPGELAADVFPVRLPDGPRDIEALFVLPGERIYLVSKGRQHGVTVYRYPGQPRADTVTLVEVQRLTSGPQPLLAQVTGASASRAGASVAIRTYQSLQFYAVDGDSLVARRGGLVNLRTLEEIQGEGVGLGDDGWVVLTSEGGPLGGPASLRTLRCSVDA
jgi:hypothetical protein